MKNSFVLYTDYLQHVSLLKDEDAGKLFKAIMMYASGDSFPPLEGMAAMAFSFISSRMDRDAEEYKKKVDARREAGKQGGRPKASEFSEKQEKAKKANGFFAFPEKAKESKEKQKNPDNVPVNDNVLENDKKNIYSPHFEEAWSVYPRKKEKAAAFKAYQARLKEGFPEDELLLAVKRYAQDCKTLGTEEQYIKHGATFFGANKPFLDYMADDYKPAVLDKGKSFTPNRFKNFKEHDCDYDALMKQAILKQREDLKG